MDKSKEGNKKTDLRSWLTTSMVNSFFRCFKSFTTSARAFQSDEQ